ncbi:Ig-like domain-containing protein [Thalassotalea psychrophila]|uniref:Ig-like domain-containing protein n=1 Tax=Thalassotalea psychrophila TaxID=3065647 RepID=A0ABY9TWY1_9GAMM|nr:Ig-like domain-containing protein [Colwelliaceae bacterium SQ149]
MENKKLICSLFTAVLLTGCGGGGGGGSSDSTKVDTNTAPVAVADTGTAQNNNSVTVNVLENDTDAEQNSLSITNITTAPGNGSAEISGSSIVYTPNTDFAGSDSLTYAVSDGEFTATAELQLAVNHTLTIAGQVTDSPIANAEVTFESNGQVYSTTADAEGNYSLDIVIDDMFANLILTATGSSELGQENVQLILFVGEAKSLLQNIDESRELVSDPNATNITHVSTAMYLLAKDLNDDKEFTTIQEYLDAASQISVEELIETATFIKLMIDNENFNLPSGETIITFLDNTNGGTASTVEAINVYLEINDLVDENGFETIEYSNAFEAAKTETVNDPNVVLQFTEDMLIGESLVELNDTQEGWLDFSANVTKLNANGLATNYGSTYRSTPTVNGITWSVESGKLIYSYDQLNSVMIREFSNSFEELVNDFGFDQSVQNELLQAQNQGIIPSGIPLEIRHGFINKTITLLAKSEDTYKVEEQTEYGYELVMPSEMNWQADNPLSFWHEQNTVTYVKPNTSVLKDAVLADLIGDWVMSLDYTIDKDYWSLQPVDVAGSDVVSINETTASSRLSSHQFSVAFENGTITLKEGAVTYRITPFQQTGKNYLAYTEKLVNNTFDKAYVWQMSKFDTTYPKLTNNLATELPEFQLANINGYFKEHWEGDKLKLAEIWGYQFKADGTLRRGIYGEPANSGAEIEVEHFYLGDERWTWDTASNVVNLRFSDYYSDRHRTWEVINVDDNGRALVFEYSTWGMDKNEDGVVTADETGQFIYPRINTVSKEDMSDWAEAWKNTQDYGLVN